MSGQEQSQQAVVEALAQHSSYLHRASSATVNRMLEVFNTTSREMVRSLTDRLDNLTPAELNALSQGRYITDRLKGVRNLIDHWAEALDTRFLELFNQDAEALADQEAAYIRELLGKVGEGDLPPAPTGLLAATMAQPVLGEFVEDMLSGIPERARQRVYSTIRQGIAAGQTSLEIARALQGTKALKRKDGALQSSRVAVERAVRTARSHISNATYEQTYQALGVGTVVWASTLEGRTCKRCAPLDGERFEAGGSHPRPPLHPNCRCHLAPSFDDDTMGERPYVRALKVKGRDTHAKFRPIRRMTEKQRREAGLKVGQVSAKTTYADWFGRQDAAYQKEWLGPKRYKLYREGGYSLDRFTDPRHKAYTIDELRQRDRETFEALFGEA